MEGFYKNAVNLNQVVKWLDEGIPNQKLSYLSVGWSKVLKQNGSKISGDVKTF